MSVNPLKPSNNFAVSYEFLGGELGERYVEVYHKRLKTEGLENNLALNQVTFENDFVTNVNPLSIAFGSSIMFEYLYRRSPSIPIALSLPQLDNDSMIHGKPSFFNGIIADTALYVQNCNPNMYGGASNNKDITSSLRKQLGLTEDRQDYQRSSGREGTVDFDLSPNTHILTSLNNIEVTKDDSKEYGLNLKFRNPSTAPKISPLDRFRNLSLYMPNNGNYLMPAEFSKENISHTSVTLPGDYGTMRVYINGSEGLKIGGPNLSRTSKETRLLVVEGGKDRYNYSS